MLVHKYERTENQFLFPYIATKYGSGKFSFTEKFACLKGTVDHVDRLLLNLKLKLGRGDSIFLLIVH